MKKVELLAPAGSFEKAKIAFLYGADAVYCGTASLSLRSRAAIDDEDFIKRAKEDWKRRSFNYKEIRKDCSKQSEKEQEL